MNTDPVIATHVADGSESHPSAAEQTAAAPGQPRTKLIRHPGVMAISAYMLLLAVVAVVGILDKRFPVLYLIFPVLFTAAGLGLLLLLRWAWALSLAAVAMLTGLFLYSYSTEHSVPALAQGLINLIIFLYLVRTDIREQLR